MSRTYGDVLRGFHDVAIEAATHKLGRALTEEEVQAVRRVPSLMLMEAYINGFESHVTPREQVEEELASLVRRSRAEGSGAP